MLILHTSDVHLHAPLTSHFDKNAAAARRSELQAAFSRLVAVARGKGVSAFLIAGDLFDTQNVPDSVFSQVAALIKSTPDITFYYLPGNHEKTAFCPRLAGLPNVRIFDDTYRTFDAGDGVFISGCTALSPDLWGRFEKHDGFDLVMLHGNLGDKTDGETVGIKDAERAGADYLALGHYHAYRDVPFGIHSHAVYPGTPEGRGFDECGEKGYVLLDTDKNEAVFHPFATRQLHDLKVELCGAENDTEANEKIRAALRGIPQSDLVRVTLTGKRKVGYQPNVQFLELDNRTGRFSFSVRDESQPEIHPEDFRLDCSLRGEFIRLVEADGTLDKETKNAVIEMGLSALMGGTV